MTTSFSIKLYPLTLAVFLIIDMIWLGLVARTLYRKYLGFLMSPSPNWAAAILFYLLFIAGLLVFAVLPGLKAESMSRAVLLGALFGLVSYATYDLTNLATIKDWPLVVTIVDMIWGTFLAASVSWISYLIGSWLK
jgi:uncharacterized membrane protein